MEIRIQPSSRKSLSNPSPYARFYTRFYEDLRRSQLAPGTRIQSLRKLAKDYNVSYVAVQQVVKKLQEEGILQPRQGDGVYITDKIDEIATPSPVAVHQEENISSIGLIGNQPGSRSKCKSIGVVMPYWVKESGQIAINTMLQSVLAYTDQHGWRIELIHNTDSEAQDYKFAEKIVSRHFDGVIWLQPVQEHELNIMRLLDKGIYVVTTTRRFPRLPIVPVSADIGDMAAKLADSCLQHSTSKPVVITGLAFRNRSIDYYCKNIIIALQNEFAKRGIELLENDFLELNRSWCASEILKLFLTLKNNPQSIILLYDHFRTYIEELDSQDFWQNPQSLHVIDVAAQWCYDGAFAGRVPIKKVKYPLQAMGAAVMREFERVWCGSTSGPELDLTTKVV